MLGTPGVAPSRSRLAKKNNGTPGSAPIKARRILGAMSGNNTPVKRANEVINAFYYLKIWHVNGFFYILLQTDHNIGVSGKWDKTSHVMLKLCGQWKRRSLLSEEKSGTSYPGSTNLRRTTTRLP